MAPDEPNVSDLVNAWDMHSPSLHPIWVFLFTIRFVFARRPVVLRRCVQAYRFGDLKGRAALVADIRRELSEVDRYLDRDSLPPIEAGGGKASVVMASPAQDGGGLVWRLAMLRAFDELSPIAGG